MDLKPASPAVGLSEPLPMGEPGLEPEDVVSIAMVRELQPPMSEARSAIEPEPVMNCEYVFESESPLLDEEEKEKGELVPHHHYAVEAAAIPALAGLVTYEIAANFVERAMSAPVEAHFSETPEPIKEESEFMEAPKLVESLMVVSQVPVILAMPLSDESMVVHESLSPDVGQGWLRVSN